MLVPRKKPVSVGNEQGLREQVISLFFNKITLVYTMCSILSWSNHSKYLPGMVPFLCCRSCIKTRPTFQVVQWLWHSWQSGRFQHRLMQVRIQSSFNSFTVNCLEKTEMMQKRPGMDHLKSLYDAIFISTYDPEQRSKLGRERQRECLIQLAASYNEQSAVRKIWTRKTIFNALVIGLSLFSE